MAARRLPPNETVVEMYQSGLSTNEIAEVCGVKPVTVVSLLRRLNIPRRSNAEAQTISIQKGRRASPSYWTGKKQPEEMVERRVSKIRGENHYLWKGGNSIRAHRGVVPKETCSQCGTGDSLGIHHKDLDHYNNDPSNLEVLCVSCHMSLHKKEYWDAIHSGAVPPKSNGPVGWKH